MGIKAGAKGELELKAPKDEMELKVPKVEIKMPKVEIKMPKMEIKIRVALDCSILAAFRPTPKDRCAQFPIARSRMRHCAHSFLIREHHSGACVKFYSQHQLIFLIMIIGQ